MKKNILLFLYCLFFINSYAQTPQGLNGWDFDGTIKNIAEDANYVYMSGQFNQFIKPGVMGAQTAGTGVLSTGTGAPITDFPAVTGGSISVVIPDNLGGWFIGGTFKKVGNVNMRCLAHIKADKTLDLNWNANITFTTVWDSDGIFSMALSGNDLYICGSYFLKVGGLSRRLAKISALNGVVDATWNPDPNEIVTRIVFFNNNLYIIGAFSNVGGYFRPKLAKLLMNGESDINFMNGLLYDSNIYLASLAVSSTGVYIGGNFTSIGTTPRNYIAKLSITSGGLDTNWNPNILNTNTNGFSGVTALLLSNNNLYIGGYFTSVGGLTRNNLAQVSAVGTGQVVSSWSCNADSGINSITSDNTDLYVGGNFQNIGNKIRAGVAKISIATAQVDNTWNPNPNYAGAVVAVFNANVYVGGGFTFIGGITKRNIARIQKSNLELDPDWGVQMEGNSIVSDMLVSDNFLYLAGNFQKVDGLTRNNIARVSTLGAGGVDANWNPNMNNSVLSLLISNNFLYAGGSFTSAGGLTRNRIAKISTLGTGAVDANWNPNFNADVLTMCSIGTDLYVGGSFTNFNNTNINRLAKISTLNTGIVDVNWTPNPNASVTSITVLNTDIYIGGTFTVVSGVSKIKTAKILSSGSLDNNWTFFYNDFNITKIQAFDSRLYVCTGPYFHKMNTNGTIDNLWQMTFNNNSNISTFSAVGNNIYIGGDFIWVNNQIPISKFVSTSSSCPNIVINVPTSIQYINVGSSYSQNISITGNNMPFTAQISGMPSGFTFNPDFSITGNTNQSIVGSYWISITVTQTNGCTTSKSFNLRICEIITYLPSVLPDAIQGASYNQFISTNPIKNLWFDNIQTQTIGGLSYTQTTQGLNISGIVNAPLGTYNVVVVGNDNIDICPLRKEYTINVVCPNIPSLAPSTLPNPVVGKPYNYYVSPSGLIGTLTWSVQNGTLPQGLVLTSIGAIRGIPSEAGTFNFTIKAINPSSCQSTVTYGNFQVLLPEPIVQQGSAITQSSFNLTWNQIPNVSYYELDVATDQNFTNFVNNYQNRIVNNNSIVVENVNWLTRYFCRVRAVQSTNNIKSNNSNIVLIQTTPTEDANFSKLVKIYPNPAKEKIFFDISDPKYGKVKISITSKEGKIISNFEYINDLETFALDISQYASGIYFVSIESENAKTIKKIIKY